MARDDTAEMGAGLLTSPWPTLPRAESPPRCWLYCSPSSPAEFLNRYACLRWSPAHAAASACASVFAA